MAATTTVLLVEDDEAHAELIERAFRRGTAYQVRHASSLSAAREMLTGDPPDLVIADLKLPDGWGTDLIALNGFPLIVITSHGDEARAVDAMKAGALDYIVKSETTLPELPHIVDRSLREWRLLMERKRLEEALSESQRLAHVGMSAAMLAHEVGNPLNNMFLHAQVLERKAQKQGLDESIASGLQSILTEIRRLSSLVKQFREFSKRHAFNFEATDLEALIGSLLDSTMITGGNGSIRIERDVGSDLLIEASPDQLTQVLVNLCKNAIEAMPDGGTLTLRAHREADNIMIEVSDTGHGIPDELNVFEAFRTTKRQGTGLGLSIVQQLILGHGGTVTYTSTPGSGTTFRISLPARQPSAPPAT